MVFRSILNYVEGELHIELLREYLVNVVSVDCWKMFELDLAN